MQAVEMSEASAAVEMADKLNKLLRDNVVTDVIKKMIDQTAAQVAELEKFASDIENFTIKEGLKLMRQAVELGEKVKIYGEDWAMQKTEWSNTAESLVEVLRDVEMNTEEHMEIAELLVDEIVEGTEKFIDRGRKLRTEVMVVKKESEAQEKRIENSGKAFIAMMEEKKKKEKLWHILWAGGLIFPPVGLIPGAIATIIVEGYSIPELKSKIKNVKGRMEDCTKVWGNIRTLTSDMHVLLQKWIDEAKAIKTAAKKFQNDKNARDKFTAKPGLARVKAKIAKSYQKTLIKSFMDLSETLKMHA